MQRQALLRLHDSHFSSITCWAGYFKHRALAGRPVRADRTAVPVHNLLAQSQPDAAPRIFIAMEPLKNGENPFSIFVIEPGANRGALRLRVCRSPAAFARRGTGSSGGRKNSPRDPSLVVPHTSTAAQKHQM
jgi:hypothetical protein